MEKLKYAGPWRVGAYCVLTAGAGKFLWDSWRNVYQNFAGRLTLDTRRARFDPARVPKREPRDG